jgi:Ribbon-helix-helix protein, copG family
MAATSAPAVAERETTDTELATKTAKLTVSLPVAAIRAIEAIAGRYGKSKTQVLREAIGLRAYIEREVFEKPGTQLLIKRGDETREVVFLPDS